MGFLSQEFLQVLLDAVSHPIKMCIELVDYSNVITGEVVTSFASRSLFFCNWTGYL